MVRIHSSRKDWGGVMIKLRGRRNIPNEMMSFGRHLVYAEGTKTEPLYVDDLKTFISKELNVSKDDVEIITPKTNKSLHTVELVEYAISDVIERRNDGETIDYVWVFYDKDEYEDFDDAYRLIIKQNSNGEAYSNGTTWFACWSNECFEVWAYHYFENLESELNRSQYIKKINAFLKKNGCKEEYTKNRKDLHQFLTNNGGDIRLAMRLMKKKDEGNPDPKPNPSSGIYQFAEYILAYIDNKNKVAK